MTFRVRDRIRVIHGKYMGRVGYVMSDFWWFGIDVILDQGPRDSWGQQYAKIPRWYLEKV